MSRPCVIKIKKKNWVYIKRKQVCTESKQLSLEVKLTAKRDSYNHEYNILKENKELPTNNRLLSFRSIIKNNLIRIGGKLNKRHLSYKPKHQILLNNDHPLSRIVFYHQLERVRHAGCEQPSGESKKEAWM